MRMRIAAGLLLATLPARCAAPPPPPAPVPPARYVVGEPYVLGGVWSYPREDHALVETGLAETLADAAPGRATATGGRHDPAVASAAHRTLQLPAVVAVTNLETGRTLRLLLDDRGPVRPGRVLGLSRRAAALLGVPAGGTARVRLAVDAPASRMVAAGLPGSVALVEVAAAPREAVEREALPPPPGVRAAPTPRPPARGPVAPAATASAAPLPAAAAGPSETVTAGVPAPGSLWVEGGVFSRRDLAERQAARLGGAVSAVGSGRQARWRVRAGPHADVAAADRALERALAVGVSDARILVD